MIVHEASKNFLREYVRGLMGLPKKKHPEGIARKGVDEERSSRGNLTPRKQGMISPARTRTHFMD